MQKAPIQQSHIYRQIKILQTILEEGHPRNIPVKLFQNLTSSFGEEDFLRISSGPYSARSPNTQKPCLWRDQNFVNTFWKGSPKEHSCKIISKSDQQFRRRFFKNFFMSLYSARSPHSSKPCFGADQNFATIFEKGHPRNIPAKLFQNLTCGFEEEDFFKEFLHVHIVQEAPIHQSHVYGRIKILRTFLKRVTQGTFLWNYFKIRPAVSEKKIL